jgi:hypothetical protein
MSVEPGYRARPAVPTKSASAGAPGRAPGQLKASLRTRVAVGCACGLGAALLLLASRATAPAFDEVGYLAQVERCAGVVRAVAERGVRALLADDVQSALGGAGDRLVLEALLGAWSRLSAGRVGLLDLLSSSRVPALVLGLLAPAAVYVLARPSLGRRAAGASAVLLALHPGWLHACAVTAEGARIGSIWLLVLAAHQASLGSCAPAESRARLVWSVVCGLALGLGVALSEAALWVLPLLLAHYWVSRHRSVRRLVRRARFPLPSSALACALLAPVGSVALNPTLWKKVGIGVVRWWLDPLSSAGLAAGFTGPRGVARAIGWVWDTSPLVTLLCAMLGLGAIVHRALARRFASGSLRPKADRHALGALVVLGLAFTLVLPACLPRVLSPPALRPAASLPFLALAAGWGLEAIARFRVGERRALWVVATGAVLAGVGLATSGLPTLGGDGSELGPVAAAVDRLGVPEVTLDAPDVPADYWRALAAGGRMRTLVRPPRAGETPEFVLRRGSGAPGAVLATVTRRGAALWTLVRR